MFFRDSKIFSTIFFIILQQMKYLYAMIDLTNAIKVSETSKGEVILGTLYYEKTYRFSFGNDCILQI